jgi:hypothetical protein
VELTSVILSEHLPHNKGLIVSLVINNAGVALQKQGKTNLLFNMSILI